ncbi:MAG: PEP-CTERM sorting domain-containing protein [Sedimentisphaerales bacterium]|nr:PEP-CTERM sorting domain-containing protein [Sedimentisphaerales bacterium]
MKKLLAILLVLGMASMASAALSLSSSSVDILAGGTATVYVVSDAADVWEGYIGGSSAVDGGGATAFTVTALAPAGPDGYATADPYGYAGYYAVGALDFNPEDTITVTSGNQFQIDASDADLTSGSSYDINVYADDWATVIDTVTINIIPEPMTLSLLGLGGLLLRRRR